MTDDDQIKNAIKSMHKNLERAARVMKNEREEGEVEFEYIGKKKRFFNFR